MTGAKRYQYYYNGDELVIEFYGSFQTYNVALANGVLVVQMDGDSKEYQFNMETRLLGSSPNKQRTKVTCRFSYVPPKQYEVFRGQIINKQDAQRKADMWNELGEQDEVKSISAAIQSVYQNADDRTRRSMLESYYESQGRIISSQWESDD